MPDAQPTPEELRSAMWSFYAHGTFGLTASFAEPVAGDVALPESVRPIPMHGRGGAIDLLLRDESDHGRSRRRRALMKLAGLGLLNRERVEDLAELELGEEFKQMIPELRRGGELLVRDLAGDAADALLQSLEQVEPSLAPARVSEELVALAAPGDCISRNESCSTCIDGQTGLITVTATAEIQRPLSELAAPLDPRSICHCSNFFLVTREVVAGTYTNALLPAAYGGGWSGPMRERVATTGAAIVQNVLEIDYLPGTNVILMNFKRIKGELPVYGMMVQNFGYMLAEPVLGDPGWTRLTMVKSVKFDVVGGNRANTIAATTLCMWLDEATQDVPCCDPPAPTECP